MRRIFVVLGLLVSMLAAVPLAAQAATITAPLDVRLGGTRGSFEHTYGDPATEDISSPDAPVAYEVKGYGQVLASFHDDRVISIALYSKRDDADSDRHKSDDADWTVKKADELARRFAPGDANFAEPSEDFGGMNYRNGGSNALANDVPTETYAFADEAPQPGGFQSRLHVTDSGDVSFLDVSLKVFEIPTGDETVIEFPTGGDVAEPGAEQPSAPAATGFSVPEQAYATQVELIMTTMSGNMQRFSELMSNPNVGDTEWTIAVVLELRTWKQSYQDALALTPPTAFAEQHAVLLQAMSLNAQAADNIATGIVNGDASQLQAASDNMAQANVLLDQAKQLVDVIVAERGG